MSAAAVLVERADGVAVITLDRPAIRNAIDRPTADALSAALDDLDARDDVRAAVLTGAGGVFSAGMDLKAFAATGERPVTPSRGGFGIVERPPRTPLIAAVEGAAVGGGFEIALACDMIVAGDTATFGLPEVRRGLVAAGGGLLRIADRLPRNLALELALTGERIDAARAREIGVANHVVPAGEALATATGIARAIAEGAPLAVSASKALVDEAPRWDPDERFARQAPVAAAVRESEDAREGARAFVEKRRPAWLGR